MLRLPNTKWKSLYIVWPHLHSASRMYALVVDQSLACPNRYDEVPLRSLSPDLSLLGS